MKAYELLENTPDEINGFKKVPFDNLKEDYPFELNSEEENSFYKTLTPGWDDKQFLWYENDKKAYYLYVMLNDDKEVEFRYVYLNVLWAADEFGEAEYEGLDDAYLDVGSFEEAVKEFLDLL